MDLRDWHREQTIRRALADRQNRVIAERAEQIRRRLGLDIEAAKKDADKLPETMLDVMIDGLHLAAQLGITLDLKSLAVAAIQFAEVETAAWGLPPEGEPQSPPAESGS